MLNYSRREAENMESIGHHWIPLCFCCLYFFASPIQTSQVRARERKKHGRLLCIFCTTQRPGPKVSCEVQIVQPEFFKEQLCTWQPWDESLVKTATFCSLILKRFAGGCCVSSSKPEAAKLIERSVERTILDQTLAVMFIVTQACSDVEVRFPTNAKLLGAALL